MQRVGEYVENKSRGGYCCWQSTHLALPQLEGQLIIQAKKGKGGKEQQQSI